MISCKTWIQVSKAYDLQSSLDRMRHQPTLFGGAWWVSMVALRGGPAEALWALGCGVVLLLTLMLPMSRWPASTADPALRSALSAVADLPTSGPLPEVQHIETMLTNPEDGTKSSVGCSYAKRYRSMWFSLTL